MLYLKVEFLKLKLIIFKLIWWTNKTSSYLKIAIKNKNSVDIDINPENYKQFKKKKK